MEEFEGADWVQISDEVPVDEGRRDELLQASRSTTTRARWWRTQTTSRDDLEEDDQEVGRE